MRKLLVIFLLLMQISLYGDEDQWDKSFNHIYLSVFDLSYTYSEGSSFGLDLISLNFDITMKGYTPGIGLYTGLTLFDMEIDPISSEFSFIRLNMYLTLFNITSRSRSYKQLYDFIYIYGYPISFTYENSEFSYKPQIVIGNEFCFTQELVPGTLGISFEYKITNIIYYNDFNPAKDFKFNIFYKHGGAVMMP